ncbi:MAG TPA: hypothetical protein VGQ44_02515 [Gemmatimonadaceae bacterium]|nr:hypothetical protein [Gemmatimonadaceae bacterium]
MLSFFWGDRAFRAARARTVTVVAMLAAGSLYAQAPATDTTFHCDGKTITGIDVESQPPAIVGRDPSAVRRFMQHVLFQSGTTHESRIRAFLLAHIDQRCSDELLPELARVVRAEPYIASAKVTAVSDGADGVRLKVETVDEVPVIIGGGISKGGLSNVKYGNSNIGGTGLLAAGQWRDGRAYRDGLSLSMRQYGLAGQPVVAELDAHREPLGGSFSADVSRPFYSDLEHIAWYMGGTHENAYRPFVRPSEDGLIVPVARDVWSTGVVARFSWKSAGFLVGPVVTYEHARPGSEGFVASDSGLLLGDSTAFKNRYTTYRTFRGGIAAGVRWLDYMRVSGFDALLGEQDVARGIQVAGTVERGFGLAQATDQSSLVSLNLYSGIGTPRSFLGVALRGEELPAGGGDSWSAGVLSGRSAWYFKPTPGATFTASAEFSGGWRERLPLQLSLGDPMAGLRGYNGAAIAGGRRMVVRLEERQNRFATGKYSQWGTAIFTDIGKTWAGDVPFGQTTVARASVGVSLLAAVPPTSRRMLRADVAVPVTGDAPKKVVFRVYASDMTRLFWRDPSDLAPVRAGAPTTSIFGWP